METAGPADTNEDTIASFTLPANSLNSNGQALRIRAIFKHAANTNGVTFKLYFGATSLSSGSEAASGEILDMELLVIRRGSSSCLVVENLKDADGAAAPAIASNTDDLTTNLVIKATVQGASSGADGLLESLQVEFLQKP